MATNYQDFQAGGSSNQLPSIYLSDSIVVGDTIITSNSIVSISITSITYPSGGSALPAGGQTITLTGSFFEVGVTLTLDGNSVSVTRVSSTSATFTSPAKSAGTYTVVLTNPDGTSASINMLYSSTLPGAPTIGTATATGTTTATVAYTAPASDGGSTITSYTAISSPGGITGTLNQAGSGTITVSGLSQGTAYVFTVTATNGVGTGSASGTSNSITTFSTPVNSVAPVVSGTATYGQTLSSTTGIWTGTATITYTYQWQRNGSNISSATSSTYTLVNADIGTTIRCVVTGTNTYGSSSANSNSTSTISASVPNAPTIGTATATSATTATVSFTAPADNGGATITSYTATSSPGNITGTLSQAGSGTITVSGLTTGTAYTFTVTATNSIGTSSASSASNSTTTYSAPVNTIAPAVTGTATNGQVLTSSTGTWTGLPTPTYTYQWQRGGVNISSATSSTYTLVTADVGSAIRCVVTATNSVSAVSANSNATAAISATVPNAPTIGTATATSATTATVSFTAPADNGGATITTYTATSSPGNITGTLSQAGSGTITVSGLSGTTSYTFTVTATNGAGTSSASSASNSITTPSAAPTTIGQAFGGGYYAGKISTTGDGVATHYLIVAPKESGESTPPTAWGGYGTFVAGTDSLIDGPTNTATFAALGAAYVASNYAKNLNIGGYTDWYVPAKNELTTLYWFLKPGTSANATDSGASVNAVSPQPYNTNNSGDGNTGSPLRTTATDFQIGGAQVLPTYVWGSTQQNAQFMWTLVSSNGTIGGAQKYNSNRAVRAVRRIPI